MYFAIFPKGWYSAQVLRGSRDAQSRLAPVGIWKLVGRVSASIGFEVDERDGSQLGVRVRGDEPGVTGERPVTGYEIEFFRRPDGSEPLRRFLGSLSEGKRDALLAALKFVLARNGLDVCRSEWGKQLGGGLAELRLRHDEREVLAGHSDTDEDKLPGASPEKILLRVFFHAHGNRMVLLLSGYDKSGRSSARHQQREIERARGYLKEWQAEQARHRRATSDQAAQPRGVRSPRRRGRR